MDEDSISKLEDTLIRRWVKSEYSIKLQQYALWNMTPQEAVDYLKQLSPHAFKNIKTADIEKAARRKD